MNIDATNSITIILRCSPKGRASKDATTSAYGASFETPRKGAAPSAETQLRFGGDDGGV
ncbi:hypothetical protein [Tardiphaga sp.]|uniref:hypothetical protein n=1 Tax=Tardiphaga sp. TaxID=1926292 RepID=UPI002633EF07|nr:hypothetical protein [Tardiphaga sp.]